MKKLNCKQKELDKRYLRMAAVWAENSYCKRRQVGVLIVKDKMIISDGYNGTPSGFENVCEDENGVTKPYVLHAEANAITQCAKNGTSCNGAVLYVTTQPCVFCCIALIQAGIKKVVFKGEYPTGLGLQLLEESGVEYIKYENELEDERKASELKQLSEAKRIEEFLSKPKRY